MIFTPKLVATIGTVFRCLWTKRPTSTLIYFLLYTIVHKLAKSIVVIFIYVEVYLNREIASFIN